MKKIKIRTFFLEMTSKEEFQTKDFHSKLTIIPVENRDTLLNFILFCGVGLHWQWYGRTRWTYQQWSDFFRNNKVKTFLAFHNQHLVGYYELLEDTHRNIEIKYIGLLKPYLDLNLGGALLSSAIEDAWKQNPNRVWVHTCELDHPNALKNYLARGFKVYKEEIIDDEYLDNEEIAAAVGGYFIGYKNNSFSSE